MRVKLFTFRYSASIGGFDDRSLLHFTRDKEVLNVREHFFRVNEVPHVLCLLTWQDAVVTEEDLALARAAQQPRAPDPARLPIQAQSTSERRPRKRSAAPDPTAGLDERQRVRFNTLRSWRAAQAKEEGLPPYLIFNNKHLVELVTQRPDSPTALMNLHGIGPGKVKRYGERILKLLADEPDDEPGAESTEGTA